MCEILTSILLLWELMGVSGSYRFAMGDNGQ